MSKAFALWHKQAGLFLLNWGFYIYATCSIYKALYMLLHVQLLNKRTADNSYYQTGNNVYDSNLCAEDAHKQNKRAEIYHR